MPDVMPRRKIGRYGLSASAPTVLCIDDDPEISRAIERQLQPFDVRVVRSFHGMQGYSAAIKEFPALVIMDLGMPGGDGQTVIECLKRNRDTASIPIILLTGLRDDRLPAKLFAMGADQFLRKPVPCDLLLTEIRRWVDLQPRRDEDF